MLAMMHVLVRDGLVDRTWVDAHTVGFDELAAHVADWTPRAGSRDLRRRRRPSSSALAHDYGTIRPAAIRTLIGAEHHENGAMFYRTLAVLPALVGAWQDRGGGLPAASARTTTRSSTRPPLSRPDLLAGRTPRAHQHEPPRRGAHRPGARPAGRRRSSSGTATRWSSCPTPSWSAAAWPATTCSPSSTSSSSPTPPRYADIVLPATTQIEPTDVVPAWGHLWMGWNEAAIAPLGESCSNTELFRRLAAAMGFDEPALFDDDETLLAAGARRKVDLDELRRVGWLRVPYPEDGRPWGAGVFPTPSGKVELVSETLARMGQPALPTFVAPREGPHGDPDLAPRYPLQLLTPKHHTRFLNSGYSHLPKHGPAEGGPFVELDAVDAAAAASPTATRAVLERPGQRRAPGADQRRGCGPASSSSRSAGGTAAPRRQVGQRAHQRHAHRVGRRRRLQRHPRPGVPVAAVVVPLPSTNW